MRARMGVYETRIFMRIVERCQGLLPKSPFKAVLYEVPGGWSYRFAFTLSSLTTSHNYRYVKNACENLKNVTVQRYDIDKRQWCMAGLIKEARINEQSGILQLEVSDWVCEAILDFRKGWRTYDLEKAMTIRNPFALRMYLLTCTQTQTLLFPIDYLRDLLLGQGSTAYTNNGDFIRRCIASSRNELEQLQLNGFDYSTVKGTGAEKGKIRQVKITPVKREERDTKNTGEQLRDIEAAIPTAMMQYLTLQCGFTTKEIGGKNLPKLQRFAALPDWQFKLADIVTRWRKHRYGHGWLIRAIEKEGRKQ